MPTRYVQLPNGKYLEWPEGVSASDFKAKASRIIQTERPAGLPAGEELPGVPKAPTPAMNKVVNPLPALQTAGNVAVGAGKGLLHTVSGTDEFARKHLPAVMTNSNMGLGPPANLEHVREMATPEGTAQKIGYGGEQAGEFLLPGGAEKKGAARLAEIIPQLGRFARPAANIATSALSSGTINAAQGGSPVTGALMGAGGQVIGQGLKAMAPAVAEGALNIRKLDRAYGKNGGSIGRSILDETRGIRPGTVAESAEDRLAELNPQLNAAADRASVKPNPVRRLLTAPPEEIPLHESPSPRNPKMRPMAFPAKINPEVGLEPRSGNTMASISEYPEINPHYLSGSAHPELSGRISTAQGVLIRPSEVGNGPIPSMLSNPTASLAPARGVLSSAFGTAARQGERTTTGQLYPMATHLGETISGERIPENITPRQLLDLKRGFGNEFIHRWNPETMTGVKGTAANTYHQMANEFNRVVPEAEGLNSRISNLIPVAKRASSEELNAPTMQRAVYRFAAHTGALTGAGVGGAVGYKEGGIPGAVAGGLTGLVAPELIASPEGQMMMARGLYKANALRPLTGSLLQLDRKKENQ
jgi:hypothetical protein